MTGPLIRPAPDAPRDLPSPWYERLGSFDLFWWGLGAGAGWAVGQHLGTVLLKWLGLLP